MARAPAARAVSRAEVTRPSETLDEKIARVLAEEIELASYDSSWPRMFQEEKARLLAVLPNDMIRRIEHVGSTAIPGLAAKPIVDMLVEVTDVGACKTLIAPLLEARGYDYFWHPNHGDRENPFYA